VDISELSDVLYIFGAGDQIFLKDVPIGEPSECAAGGWKLRRGGDFLLRFKFDMLCLPVIYAATGNNSLACDNKTILQTSYRSLQRFQGRQCYEPDPCERIALVQGSDSFRIERRSPHPVTRLKNCSIKQK
jgi:hypothetical protein